MSALGGDDEDDDAEESSEASSAEEFGTPLLISFLQVANVEDSEEDSKEGSGKKPDYSGGDPKFAEILKEPVSMRRIHEKLMVCLWLVRYVLGQKNTYR